MNLSPVNLDLCSPSAGPQTLLETLPLVTAQAETKPTAEFTAESTFNERFGRYRIKKLLGQGGMGAVFLAEDTQLGRDVALKIPRKNKSEDWTSPHRFLRETRAVANLQHPNICPLYDAGELDGQLFMAMAYIDGAPLTASINPANPLSAKEAATIIRKVALALEEAHARGIIHRDLKPANIMIDRRGEPIVMDFGLACRVDVEVDTKLTQDGMIVGTPAYMAPEQFSHNTSGVASDIYSLAVVMYELVSGKCPFSGSIVTVIGQVMHWNPAPLAEERPDVPARFSEICRRAMQKNPADRFATMHEFAAALTQFLQSESEAPIVAELIPDQTPPHQELNWVRQNWAVLTAATAIGTAGGLIWAMLAAGSIERTLAPSSPSAVEIKHEAVEFATETGIASAVAVAHTHALFGASLGAEIAAELPAVKPSPFPKPVVKKQVAMQPTAPVTYAAPTKTQPAPPRVEVRTNSQPEEEWLDFGPELQAVLPKDLRGVNELFKKADRNNDNKLDGGELFLHIVHRVDVNGDELASRDEFLNAYRKEGAAIFDSPPGGGPPHHRPPPPPRREGPGRPR